MQKLAKVFSAREFVWWYNAHPDYTDLKLDLSKTKSVAICGLGNVAVDCARVLLQPAERLASTDIAQHALTQLQSSAVSDVHLIGRRGPVQVSYATVLYIRPKCFASSSTIRRLQTLLPMLQRHMYQ